MGKFYLKVTKLGKLLPAVLKFADERLGAVMNYPMSTNVASLSEPFAACLALIRSLACMAALVGLIWPVSYANIS